MKKGNDKLTLSVNKEIKDMFKQVCDSEGLKIGKQVELFMKCQIEERKGELKQRTLVN